MEELSAKEDKWMGGAFGIGRPSRDIATYLAKISTAQTKRGNLASPQSEEGWGPLGPH